MAWPFDLQWKRRLLLISGSLLCTTFVAHAQTCSDVTVSVRSEATLDRTELMNFISVASHRSVIGEFQLNQDQSSQTKLTLEPGDLTAEDLARLLSASVHIDCSLDQGVLHFFDPNVTSLPQNALNHVFMGFSVSDDAGGFFLELKNRLHNEAFDPLKADQMAGAGGGAMSSEAVKHPLKPELLNTITARDLFVHEAQQALMNLTVEIPLRSDKGLAAAWEQTEAHMQLRISQ